MAVSNDDNEDKKVYFYLISLIEDQKGAYFRHQLTSPMSTPPLQNPMRIPQQQQQQQQQHQQLQLQQQQQQNKPPM